MVYLPDEWIINKNNKNRVIEILNKLDEDLIEESGYSIEQATKDLIKLGELKIVEKLKDNTFSFGA